MRIKHLTSLSYVDKHSLINKKVKINRFCIIRRSNIDAYSYISRNCHFNNVKVGRFCSIAKNTNIGLAIHPINFISTSPIFFSPENATGFQWAKKKTFDDNPRRTIIGNDVWIGSNVTIMGGLNIGDGVIIGSNALITKDIKPYSIVGGVPGVLIRKRFDDETIENLSESKWWLFEDEYLKNNIHLFNKPLNKETLIELKKLATKNA